MRPYWLIVVAIGVFIEGNATAEIPVDTRATESEWKAPGFSNDGFGSAADLGVLTTTALKRFGLRYSTTLSGLNGGFTPDWYRFKLLSPTTIGVTLNTWGTGYDSGSASGIPIVGLFDAQGAIDGFPLQESSSLISGLYYYQRMQTATLAPGTYAFAVSGFHGDNNNYYYDGGASFNWPYELKIHAGGSPAAPDTSSTETEWIATGFSNDGFSTATNLGVLGPGAREVHGLRFNAGTHQRLVGGISPDWYKFTITTSMVLEVALNTWGAGYDSGSASGKPIVGLFDLQGAIDGFPLHESSAFVSGTDQYERMQSIALAPGTYALAVSGFHGDNNNYYYDGGASYNWPYQLSLELTTPILPGDYNDDHVVNAADYTLWRDNFGAPPGTLLNDADGGLIDEDQYNTWKANFGNSSGSMIGLSNGADAAVPEPTTLLLLILMAVGIGSRDVHIGARQRTHRSGKLNK